MRMLYLFLFVGLITNPVFAQDHYPNWSLLEYEDAQWFGMSKDCRRDLVSLLNPTLDEIDAFAFYISTPNPNTIVVEYKDIGFFGSENQHFVIEFEEGLLQSPEDPIENVLCSSALDNAQITKVSRPFWFYRPRKGFGGSIFSQIHSHTFKDVTPWHFNAKDKDKLLQRYRGIFKWIKNDQQIRNIKFYQSLNNPRVIIFYSDYGKDEKLRALHVIKEDSEYLNEQDFFTPLSLSTESMIIPFGTLNFLEFDDKGQARIHTAVLHPWP